MAVSDIATKKKEYQSKTFCAIIGFHDKKENREITKEELKKCFDLFPFSIHYAFILHHDEKHDDGTIKFAHYHCTIECASKRTKKAVISAIHQFGISEENITADTCGSLFAYTRYLLHEDDKEKEAYSASEIITNNQGFVNECLEGINNDFLSFDQLEEIVLSSNFYSEIYAKIGLENAKKYSFVIKQMMEEKRALNIYKMGKALDEATSIEKINKAIS